tara:strand:- start:59 stop:754 length:696 start_codon:yes stop_codon:yes gene_type:complete
VKEDFDFDNLDWKSLRPKGGRFSNEKQDEFVYHLLAKYMDKPGFFLDVGCGDPKDGSNTYIFDKYFDWSGIGFDIGNVEKDCSWSEHRRTKFCRIDTTDEEFTETLEDLVGNTIVDYISLDVDWGDNIYAHRALKRIMDADIKFRVMTLEHEFFKYGDLVTKPTRKTLTELGYEMLFENVAFPDGPGQDGFEDWWVHPELMPNKNIMSVGGKNLVFHECVNRVKNFTGNKL